MNDSNTFNPLDVHTCRPTAATYVRNKHWVDPDQPMTSVQRRIAAYRNDSHLYYLQMRRAKLQAVGEEFGALLREHNATPATLDPVHVYDFVANGYDVDMDEPQRSFFRGTLGSRVSYAFEVFLGRERGEKYGNALRRAEAKFTDGEYERPMMGPVFESGRAKTVFRHLNFLHNLHWSRKFPGQVAYAESYDKLVADRWTTCKPGRYLTKYFSDILNENEIRTTVEFMFASTLPAELHYVEGNDPAGWVNVYANGPHSCMHGEDCVRVYAHDKSVLRLAYLTQNGQITARCIVREDNKEYIRVYPNTDSEDNQRWHTVMRNKIEAEGYTHGTLYGVLLDAIRVGRSYENRYVCPYIDCGNGDYLAASLEYGSNGKEYLRLGSEGGDATNTSGYVDLDDGLEQCTDCNDMVDPDEMCYIEDHGNVCSCCARDNYTMAYGRRYEELYPNDEVIQCESDGNYYHPDFASYHDVHQCEASGNWYLSSDLRCVSEGYAHPDYCVALDVCDSDGNSYAIDGSTTTTWDNRVIRRDESCVWFGKVCHADDDPNEVNATNEEGNE